MAAANNEFFEALSMLLKIFHAISKMPKLTVASNVSRARVSKSVMKHHPLRCKASGYDKNVRLPDAGPKRHRPPAVCRQHFQKTV